MPSQPVRAHTAVTPSESRHVSQGAASPYGAISEQVAPGFIQGVSSASGLARFLGFVMVPYTFLPERIAGQWECFCAGAQAPQAAVGSCGVESCKCGPRPCCASLGCRNSCCCSFNPQNNIVLAAPMSLGRFWLALLPVFGFPALSQPCWGSQLLGGQTGCRGGCILPAFPGLHSPGCRLIAF